MLRSWLLALALAASIAALDPYKALQVTRDASDANIKKAYRSLSKKWHPDKHSGDESAAARFVEISQAYEILSDKEKRQAFDQHGEEGLKRLQAGQPASGFHDARDVFARFFGGGQQQASVRRGPNLSSDITVDLKTIYTGATLPLQVKRKVLCPSCDGSGARSASDIGKCSACNGAGVRLIRQQLAPGMFTQMQMTCDQCGGRGKRITALCGRCGGHRVVDNASQLDLDIDRGLPEGSELVFEGEADESPDWEAGDVVVKVRSQSASGGFVRKGSDLYWREPLHLRDALLGFEKQIEHLDGHLLTISRHNVVTQPGHVQTIEGEGMPHHHSSGFGRLYITFDVVLPAQIDARTRSALESVLGKPETRRRNEL